MKFENMKVASYNYDNWGDEDDPKSDWSILNAGNPDKNDMGIAVFSHKEACEFIIYVNGNNWDHWKTLGYSDKLIKLARTAKAHGYFYLCLYA